jgi:hypothetical protein
VNDVDGGTIQLSVNDNTIVYCNATITDQNGYQDVSTNGGANATFWHQSSSVGAADDKNVHYTNRSCTFSGGSGDNVNTLCTVILEHEALNGTWSCNITAWDAAGATGSNNDSEYVDQLIALSIAETQIAFGSMAVNTNSSASNSTNITNEGNVQIDIQVSGNGDMSCSTLGSIGIGNISYNYTGGSYDSMSSKRLTTSAVTETSFNLGVEGVATSEDVVSNKTESWTINIPTGVRGSCSNTVTITAILG